MLLLNMELLATAPGGVAKLRELILTLAVQGKLVPQDPADEPASRLLQKIRAEKDRLIEEKKIRRSKPLDPIDESECGFELPSSWAWERLGNLGDWGAGATPSRSNSNYYGGNIPWFKSGELTSDFIAESEETVTDAALRDCSLRLNQVGDVLIAMYGATIGKTAILSVVATTNQAVCACTPFEGLSNTYLLLLLKALKPYFIGLGAGGAQPNISREKVVATVVGLPPLAEQSRVVTRVEALMRLCDALEAKSQLEAAQHAQLVSTLLGTLTASTTPEELAENWQRVAQHFDLLLDRPEAIDALEQTLLQLAVRGLLVPQDPTDEPASALLQKIRAEKDRLIATGQIKQGKPLPPITDEEKPFELPVGWEWVRINDLAEVQGGIQKTQLRTPVKQHFPYLRVANVQRDALRLEEIERFELTMEELERWRLIAGDLLIVEGNGSAEEIGRCAVWTGAIDPCVYQNHLIRVRCFQQDCMAFIKLFLNAPSGAEEMKRLAITTSGLYNLSVGKIRNYAVPMAPLAEQARIVTRVTALRRLCADLRQRLTERQSVQARLAEALVQQQACA